VLFVVESMSTFSIMRLPSMGDYDPNRITLADYNDSGMTGGRLEGNFCISTFTTPVTATSSETFSSTLGQPITDNRTILSSGTMIMTPMIVYWQESDLSKFNSEYAATLAEKFDIDFTTTATADVTPETASPPDRSQLTAATTSVGPDSGAGQNFSNTGLSSGAKAGIGVGITIGVMLLCIAGFLLYRRRLRKTSKLDRNSAIQNEQPEYVQTQAA
jgi:hypothetical protein